MAAGDYRGICPRRGHSGVSCEAGGDTGGHATRSGRVRTRAVAHPVAAQAGMSKRSWLTLLWLVVALAEIPILFSLERHVVGSLIDGSWSVGIRVSFSRAVFAIGILLVAVILAWRVSAEGEDDGRQTGDRPI